MTMVDQGDNVDQGDTNRSGWLVDQNDTCRSE